jgi:hypothetical protein
MLGPARAFAAFEGILPRWQKEHAVQLKEPGNLLGRQEVPVVRRVERTAQQSESLHSSGDGGAASDFTADLGLAKVGIPKLDLDCPEALAPDQHLAHEIALSLVRER